MHPELKTYLPWDIQPVQFPYNASFQVRHRAIVRNDTNEVLAFVGQRYTPFTNHHLHELAYYLEESGKFETLGFEEFRGGKMVLGYLKYIGAPTSANLFPTEETLIIANTHDASRQLHISRTQYLIRCQNQFNAGKNLLKITHDPFLPENIQLMNRIIKIFEEDCKDSEKLFEDLGKRIIGKKEVEEMLNLLLPVLADEENKKATDKWAKELLTSIEREMSELGSTAFGLFNGITWFTSHVLQSNEVLVSGRGKIGSIHQKANTYFKNILLQ
jgi:hypothetical protein